jgi:hypothetical protein
MISAFARLATAPPTSVVSVASDKKEKDDHVELRDAVRASCQTACETLRIVAFDPPLDAAKGRRRFPERNALDLPLRDRPLARASAAVFRH